MITTHHEASQKAAQKALDDTRQGITSMRAMLEDDRYLEMRESLQGTISEWEAMIPVFETRVQEESEGIYRMPFMKNVRLRLFDGDDGYTHIIAVDNPEIDMVLKGMNADEIRQSALVLYGIREYFNKVRQ